MGQHKADGDEGKKPRTPSPQITPSSLITIHINHQNSLQVWHVPQYKEMPEEHKFSSIYWRSSKTIPIGDF